MKIIIKKIMELLDEIDELKFIDLDKGQLDADRPEVTYPCALIQIGISNFEDVTRSLQRANAQVIIRAAFSPYSGETANYTPKSVRNESLSYLDTVDLISKKLQGYTDKNIEEIMRVGIQPERRPDRLTVWQIAFTCIYEEFFP